MNCQDLVDTLNGAFPPRTPQQIAAEGYSPSLLVPTRPNTPENANNSNEGTGPATPNAQPAPATVTSGKKRRRTEAGAVDSSQEDCTMDGATAGA